MDYDGMLTPLTWKERLSNLFCLHRLTIYDAPRRGMTCRCGRLFMPAELIYLKNSYWDEYI